MHQKSIPLIGAMLAALAAIGLAALVAWSQLSGNGSAAQSGTPGKGEAIVAPGIDIGGPFALTDQTGQDVTHADFAGNFMLVYFGFTSCPDICPTELASMAVALDTMEDTSKDAAEQVKPVFITIDPARDTPEALRDYTTSFHPRMMGLTGSAEAIDHVAKEYRVFYSKGQVVDEDFYLMNHSGYVYFMGPEGEFVTMFHGGTDPAVMAEAMLRYIGGAPTS